MYTDAYAAMLTEDTVSHAVRAALELRHRRSLRSAESCAREAIDGALCPCLAGAEGCCGAEICVRSAIIAEIARRMTAADHTEGEEGRARPAAWGSR